MSEEATKILNDAIDILNERGHCKGMLFDPDTGRVCAIGALNMATQGGAFELGTPTSPLASHNEAMSRLRGQIPRVTTPDGMLQQGRISSWNNDPKTSTEDVILAFKKAAGE